MGFAYSPPSGADVWRAQERAHKAKLYKLRAPVAERDRIDRLTLSGLRADYVAGRIEVEDFERDLDLLVERDPDALDRKPPRLSTDPGSIIWYDPSTVNNVLKEVYEPFPG